MNFTLMVFILWIALLFLVPYIIWRTYLRTDEPVKAYVSPDGAQYIHVDIQNGYHPNVIEARSGRPLRFYFSRIEDEPCSEEIILEDFGVRQLLPAYKTTQVEIIPFQPGEYIFGCGRGISQGKLIVQ